MEFPEVVQASKEDIADMAVKVKAFPPLHSVTLKVASDHMWANASIIWEKLKQPEFEHTVYCWSGDDSLWWGLRLENSTAEKEEIGASLENLRTEAISHFRRAVKKDPFRALSYTAGFFRVTTQDLGDHFDVAIVVTEVIARESDKKMLLNYVATGITKAQK